MSDFIQNIEIENFKSIRHQRIDGCKRINVFIGYPNVGKSNILEAIGMYSTLLTDGSFSFNDICRIKHPSELYFDQNFRSAAIVQLNDKIQLRILNDNNSNNLSLDFHELSPPNEFVSKLNPQIGVIEVNFVPNIHFGRNQIIKGAGKIIYPVKKYHFTNNSSIHLINGFSLNIPFGTNLLDVLQRESNLRKELTEILKFYNLKLLLDRSSSDGIMLIKELEDGSGVRIPYHQIADTLKRLIFYKAAIASNEDSILLFEEPEAHMFPPYINKFTADIIYNKKNNNQYFIATHSPFVLNDFIEDAREELSIYAVGYKGGETAINRISDEDVHNIYQYGIDTFFNLENYLKDV